MKRRKMLCLFTAGILTAGMLTGCSGQSGQERTAKETVATTAATESEAPLQGDGNAKYVMKIATAGTDGDCLTFAYKKMKETIEGETHGEVGVEIFDSSQLGSQADYIAGLRMNSIQAADIASSVLSSVDASYMIFDLPYLINDIEVEQSMLADPSVGGYLASSLKDRAGILVGGYIVRSPRNVYSSKGPIHTPGDFKNLKIRTMDSAPMIEAMNILGATATPIAANERYLALQTGVVDAAENSVMEIFIKKEYEVTGYLSKTEHLMQPNVVCLSPSFIQSLPEEYQSIVLNAVTEGCAAGTENDLGGADEIEKKLQEAGMIINEVEDKAAFSTLMAPVYETYREDVGADFLKTVEDYVSNHSTQ